MCSAIWGLEIPKEDKEDDKEEDDEDNDEKEEVFFRAEEV